MAARFVTISLVTKRAYIASGFVTLVTKRAVVTKRAATRPTWVTKRAATRPTWVTKRAATRPTWVTKVSKTKAGGKKGLKRHYVKICSENEH